MRTNLTYNQFSQLTSMTRQSGSGIVLSSQSRSFDSRGNLLSMTNGNGGPTTFTPNSFGLPTSRTDPNGNLYQFQFDSLNRLTREIDPLTDPVWTYDDASNVTSYTDANGATTYFSYDAMGRVLQETLPIDATTSAVYSFAYDDAGNLISKTIPIDYSGGTLVTATSTYTYNGLNQMVSATDTLGNVTSYSYDADGNLIGVTNPLGNTARYGYDVDDRLVSQSVPISGIGDNQVYATTTYTLDANGQTAAIADPLGRTTQYTYNLLGWLTDVTDPLGNQTIYTYNDTGDVRDKIVQSAAGTSLTWHYAYDGNGNVTSVLDPQGNSTNYAYDANDNLLTVTGANNGQGNVTYTYDAVNRLASTTDGAGNTTQYNYDPVGNLLSVTDPLGNVTSYSYDLQNRVLSVTDPLGGQTSFGYNLAGWRTSVTDPDNNVTSYGYNLDGWLVSQTNPLGYSASYSYDAAGEKIGTTDYNGQQTQYVYNEAGWLTSENWLDGQNQVIYQASFGYDNAGELTSAADNNSSYVYAYDAAGNQTQETVSYPGLSDQPILTLSYGYDGLGHRSSLADSLGGQITYGYTGDFLTQMGLSLNGDATSMQLSIAYNSEELPGTITSQSGAYSLNITYDNANRVTEMAYGNGLDFQYAYNAASQVTDYTGPEGTLHYTYDATSQLTGVSGDQTASYSFDANGNRTMTGYSTGTGNQLTSDGTYNYTYDHNGNTLTKTRISDGQVTTNTWDYDNRLTQVVMRDADGNIIKQAHYTYDVFGRRIGVWEDANGSGQASTERWTVYDGQNPYADFDAAGSLTNRYLYGPKMDELFGRADNAGAVQWYLTDRLGSVREVVADSANVLDQINYDAFGQILSETNSSAGDRFKFTAREWDGLFGQYEVRARYYAPDVGRFESEDSYGFEAGDANLYRYVFNGPINYTDPSGHIVFLPFLIIGGAILIGGTSIAVNSGLPERIGEANPQWAGRSNDYYARWANRIEGRRANDLLTTVTACGSVRYRSPTFGPPYRSIIPIGQPGHTSSYWQYVFRGRPGMWVGRVFLVAFIAEGIWDGGVVIEAAIETAFD